MILPCFSKWKSSQPSPAIFIHYTAVVLCRISTQVQKRKNPHPLAYCAINASLTQVYQLKFQPENTEANKTVAEQLLTGRKNTLVKKQKENKEKRLHLNLTMDLQITSRNYFS